MKKRHKLHECPFCGSSEVAMTHNAPYMVICAPCGAGSSPVCDQQTAANNWNRRHPPRGVLQHNYDVLSRQRFRLWAALEQIATLTGTRGAQIASEAIAHERGDA